MIPRVVFWSLDGRDIGRKQTGLAEGLRVGAEGRHRLKLPLVRKGCHSRCQCPQDGAQL